MPDLITRILLGTLVAIQAQAVLFGLLTAAGLDPLHWL